MTKNARGSELVDALLGPESPLVSQGFTFRQSQLDLAHALRNSLEDGGTSLFEAETGIGKSIAYLVVLAATNRRCVIATSTKLLQKQLLREISLLQEFGVELSFSQLNGVSNYPCLRTESGSISATYCETFDCSEAASCFYMEDRRKAQSSQVVIVNHALLLSALRTNQFENYFGKVDAILFDEAHNLLSSRNTDSTANLTRNFSVFLELADRDALLSKEQRNALLKVHSRFIQGLDRGELKAELLRFDDKLVSRFWQSQKRNSFDISALGKMLSKEVASSIFVSGTLRSYDGFESFSELLGLTVQTDYIADTVHDYGSQAYLYLPQNIEDNLDNLSSVIGELHELCGKGLVLFSSYNRLDGVSKRLSPYIDLIAQEPDQSGLASEFFDLDNTVLLATGSFWNGADLGDDLGFVLVDRLPFLPPDERDFLDFQLPLAVLKLRQGLGRLIRSERSFGVLCVFDSRLLKRSYGQSFLSVLPKDLPRTSSFEQIRKFVEA